MLRDLYVRGKYRDVILPMTVLRRLDTVLEPVKDNVRAMKAQLDDAGVIEQDAALRQAAGQAFYNTSPFTLRDLRNRASQARLRDDFEAYLDGFSPNVQDNFIRDGQDLNYSNFSLVDLPYPPLEDQALIARYLNWHGAMTGKLIRTKRRLIALLNEQKQSIIHNAVRRPFLRRAHQIKLQCPTTKCDFLCQSIFLYCNIMIC